VTTVGTLAVTSTPAAAIWWPAYGPPGAVGQAVFEYGAIAGTKRLRAALLLHKTPLCDRRVACCQTAWLPTARR
jgi:hypothetical protein